MIFFYNLCPQVYQVEYVIVKAAISPRPAAWILEKSLDGENFQPWQYYAPSDEECWARYSAPPVAGKPVYIGDDEVICTSQYSRQTPMENGEVSILFSLKARKSVVDRYQLPLSKRYLYNLSSQSLSRPSKRIYKINTLISREVFCRY